MVYSILPGNVTEGVRTHYKRQKQIYAMVWAAFWYWWFVNVFGVPQKRTAKRKLPSWVSATFGSRNIFAQVEALGNIANQLQNWCRRYFRAYFDKYIWPASSPTINSGDFVLCLILESDFIYFIFMCVISERILYEVVPFVQKIWWSNHALQFSEK